MASSAHAQLRYCLKAHETSQSGQLWHHFLHRKYFGRVSGFLNNRDGSGFFETQGCPALFPLSQPWELGAVSPPRLGEQGSGWCAPPRDGCRLAAPLAFLQSPMLGTSGGREEKQRNHLSQKTVTRASALSSASQLFNGLFL